MTGAETGEMGMERMEHRGGDDAVAGLAVVPVSNGSAPVAPAARNEMRARIETRVKVLRSLRAPTVEQIEAAQFWEEYLRQTAGKS